MDDVVFLFDVDNTLLDNDRVQRDLSDHLTEHYGQAARDRYWALFEDLRGTLGYADYLGALQRYRLEDLHNPKILRIANWLADYPFVDRLYPHALDVVRHLGARGPTVILSDGDAAFQPRKVERSGLWGAFSDNVLIYVHKEQALEDVERLYPARHYVMIDDKLRILEALKQQWGDRVTTVFPRQGHYALDPEESRKRRPADLSVDAIGDLLRIDAARFGNRP
ncbi:MAG TPA: haloacid dehalogenase [Acetobacteraceae bacterium]|jgi:FMN phosphatase YigB (HAD superfamily)|nr:haloacid dehalogenase [Acetobacteraceae bacterium]